MARPMEMIDVSVTGPFGLEALGGRGAFLGLDGGANVDESKTGDLNYWMYRRHNRRLEDFTGVRVRKPLQREDFDKIGKAEQWQTGEREKESGGVCYPDTRDAIGAEAEAQGFDMERAETLLRARGKSLVMTRPTDVIPGPRTESRSVALNPATSGGGLEAMAVNYLHQFQFIFSNAGKLLPEVGEQIDIPNGFQTYQIPRFSYAQWLKQAPVTTDQYVTGNAVTPPTDKTILAPNKLMCIIWMAGEWEDDSVSPAIPGLEKSGIGGLNIAYDHCFFSGDDTNDGTNINGLLGASDPRLLFKGIRANNYWGTIGGKGTGAFSGANQNGEPANLNMVPEMLKVLGRFGIDPDRTRTIVSATTAQQFHQDPKARPDTYPMLYQMRGDDLYVGRSKVIVLDNSIITNANSGGIPTYASQLSEGVPTNLAASGLYTGAGNYTTAACVFFANYVAAFKRRWSWQVVRLPLSDQVAVVGTVRLDVKPIFPNVSESVGYNISM